MCDADSGAGPPLKRSAVGDAPDERSLLRAAQDRANAIAGARRVPAKVIAVPTHVDPTTAALIAAPYIRPRLEADTLDDDGWRASEARLAAEGRPAWLTLRATLGVSIEPMDLNGVPAFLVTPPVLPERHARQLVFHLHGGGYVHGAGEMGTGEAMLLAAYGGYRVLSVDYRMPPDAPYPAALDDAAAAWSAVVAETPPDRIAVEGTSAGAGLALALMLRLRDGGLPLPAAMAPGSPWSDLTETGDSYKTNEWVDNVVVTYGGYLSQAARLYANGRDLKDPGLSPIYGAFHDLPPAILTAGTRDLFLSNTVRTHRKLREAGNEAELQVYEGLSHSQYLFDAGSAVTREVYREITKFFDKHLKI